MTADDGRALIGRIALLLLGGIGGFLAKLLFAERREQWAMRRAVPQLRAEAYKELWPLCAPIIEGETRRDRLGQLSAWYQKGGGLFLSFEASQRFMHAKNLLWASTLSPEEHTLLDDDLTWLRTELKYHVGSYSRGEKNRPLLDSGGAIHRTGVVNRRRVTLALWLLLGGAVGAVIVIGVQKLATAHDGNDEANLKTLVEQVKTELAEADQDRLRLGEAAPFVLKDFDLELTFTVHNQTSAEGEPHATLVAVDTDAALDTDRVQRIKIHMSATTPVKSAPGPIDVVTGAPAPPLEKAKP